jgi:RNA polymerase sigma-70 factor (ECF subfamily)
VDVTRFTTISAVPRRSPSPPRPTGRVRGEMTAEPAPPGAPAEAGSAAAREAAFRQLYAAHYQHLVAYARRRTSPVEADDVVAEAFLVTWRRWDEVPHGDLALAWLYGVARRVLSEGRRRQSRRQRLVAKLGRLGGRSEAPAADEGVGDEECVRQVLARLRPHDRELLRLAEWEELSHAELALVFGCTVNAVTIRLHRAHRRFEAALRYVDADRSIQGREEGSLG